MWKSCKVVIRALTSCSSISDWLLIDFRFEGAGLASGRWGRFSLGRTVGCVKLLSLEEGTGWWPIPRSTLFSRFTCLKKSTTKTSSTFSSRWWLSLSLVGRFSSKTKIERENVFRRYSESPFVIQWSERQFWPSNSIQMSATWFEH